MEKVYSKEEALKLSDGTRLVIYRGVLANGGDWFSVDKILFGTRRGKINRITIDSPWETYITFELDGDKVNSIGGLSGKTVEPALVTSEGRDDFSLSLPQINANYYLADNIPIIRNAESTVPILAKGNQFSFSLIDFPWQG